MLGFSHLPGSLQAAPVVNGPKTNTTRYTADCAAIAVHAESRHWDRRQRAQSVGEMCCLKDIFISSPSDGDYAASRFGPRRAWYTGRFCARDLSLRNRNNDSPHYILHLAADNTKIDAQLTVSRQSTTAIMSLVPGDKANFQFIVRPFLVANQNADRLTAASS
jgi:hypothetical protein